MATFRVLVGDVPRAVQTYVGAFGFELVDQMGTAFAIVRLDDADLWLSGPESSAQKQLPDQRKPGPGGWNRIVIEVTDLNAMIDRLKASGIAFANPGSRGPGGSQALAEDGEGNVIELFAAR